MDVFKSSPAEMDNAIAEEGASKSEGEPQPAKEETEHKTRGPGLVLLIPLVLGMSKVW